MTPTDYSLPFAGRLSDVGKGANLLQLSVMTAVWKAVAILEKLFVNIYMEPNIQTVELAFKAFILYPKPVLVSAI